jgi:hypothetical protein
VSTREAFNRSAFSRFINSASRSILRSLSGSIPRMRRRQFRALAAASGTARDAEVERDAARRLRSYEMLVLRMAAACDLPLTEADAAASFSEQ